VLRSTVLGSTSLAAAALLGCTAGPPPAASQATTAPGGATAQKPRKGGVLKEDINADPASWSLFGTGGTTYTMTSFAYERLTAHTPGSDPWSTDLHAELAVAMPEQPDGQTYVYTLHEGVKFQNVAPVNGRPLTVEDVKFSIDTITKHNLWKADYASVSSVTTPDAKTVVVKTSRPDAALLNNSSSFFGYRVFPKELLGTDLEKTNVIGTGPFIRAQYDQASKIVFKRNPDYWAPNVPYVDEMHYLIMPDNETANGAFLTKQIDILSSAGTCHQEDELWAKVKNFATTQTSPRNSPFIAFNMTQAPFGDVRVRRALSLAMNRDAQTQSLFCGSARLTGLLPTPFGLPPEKVPDLAANIKYDPKQAKDLLTAAGVGADFQPEIVWTPQYNSDPSYGDSLQLYVGNLKQIGVTATPISIDYAKWIGPPGVYRPPFNFKDMLWGTQKTLYADPNSYMLLWLHPNGISNQSRVNDPALTALLEKQQTQVDPSARSQTIHEIQNMEAKGAYYAYRMNGTGKVFVQNRVHDYHYHGSHAHAEEFRSAWLDNA